MYVRDHMGISSARRSLSKEIQENLRSSNRASIRQGLATPRTSSGPPSRTRSSPNSHVECDISADDQPRFVQRTSAIAFPRLLGLKLKAGNPPKLHSYAYNLGLRQEEISFDYGSLPIDIDSVRKYSEAFFRLPVAFFDRSWFDSLVHEYFRNPRARLGTIIGGVFAAGSCLAIGHTSEREVVHWCKMMLEDAASMRKPSIELIFGWFLRVGYLRMTTRPHCAWIASCTAVHLMESVGLHRQENMSRLVDFSSINAKTLQLLFWNMCAIHQIISFEYGRTPIELSITTRRIEPKFLDLVLTRDLQTLQDLHVDDDLLVLPKADLAFCLFRRLWQAKAEINEAAVIRIGEDTLTAAERHCADLTGFLYFAMLAGVFQYTCVLMALRTEHSLVKLSKASEVLEMIADRVNTQMARNTSAIANSLLGAVIAAKRGELDELTTLYRRGVQSPASISPDGFFVFDWTQFDAESADFNGIMTGYSDVS